MFEGKCPSSCRYRGSGPNTRRARSSMLAWAHSATGNAACMQSLVAIRYKSETNALICDPVADAPVSTACTQHVLLLLGVLLSLLHLTCNPSDDLLQILIRPVPVESPQPEHSHNATFVAYTPQGTCVFTYLFVTRWHWPLRGSFIQPVDRIHHSLSYEWTDSSSWRLPWNCVVISCPCSSCYTGFRACPCSS